METKILDGLTVNTSEGKSVRPFFFYGKGGTLFGIQIVNLLLIIVTLGIYYFWGKARVRRYIWGQIDFDGDRLSYHGTGKETFRGWLKVVLIFGVPLVIVQNVPYFIGAPVPVQVFGIIISLLMVSMFLPFAIVGMRRYRFSRTALRDIRFSYRGKWWNFAKMYLKWKALVFLTLSLYSPFSDMQITAYLMQRTYFGNRGFGFDGKGSELFRSYILSLILAFPTLMLSIVWYYYTKAKYTWNHMTFETARFKSTVSFGGVVWLYLVNGLLLVCTLGFAASWARVRSLRYYLANLTLEGQIDLATIVQEAQESTAMSEEVGDLLDMDLDLG